MDYVIYTEQAECQDCYKCLRHCPVKAIKIAGGHATVIPERCVACGTCVGVCPSNAKRFRNDLGKAKALVRDANDAIKIATLAPSWASEFPDVTSAQMIAALKQLGFNEVSETALGAQFVSQQLAEIFPDKTKKFAIASACPAANDYVCKYFPHLTEFITTVVSPAMAHARFLRELTGGKARVIFFSPCIAKKNEAAEPDSALDLAVTFTSLHQWFAEKNLDLRKLPATDATQKFFPESAVDGTMYPVEGGMLQTLKIRGAGVADYLTISGLARFAAALDNFDPARLARPLFLEMLACEGGCVNGPCMSKNRSTLYNMINSLARVPENLDEIPATPAVNIAHDFRPDRVENLPHNEEMLQQALLRIGKKSKDDELNCGGCGYDSCRLFAQALLDGRAEPEMCLSFLRKTAQKKANTLLRCMPCAVAIADAKLRVIESNKIFAEMIGGTALEIWESSPGMEGAYLDKLLPFANLLRENLQHSNDIHKDNLRAFNKILELTIFTIERGQCVGMVMTDVTRPEMKRDQIAKRAQLVMKKNLETVQVIAANLGENMAEVEILLRSLAEDYAGGDSDNG